MTKAALKRGIPVGSVLPLDELVLITLAADLFDTGRQAARLADQIFHGAKPAEFPIVSSDLILTVNLKTAGEIGIHIPDDILLQATNIIR